METVATSPSRPGRLGNPNLLLRDDPRADPRMVAALSAFGADGAQESPPVTVESSLEEKLEFVAATEAGFSALLGGLFAGLPEVRGVTSRIEQIDGPAGDQLPLYIHTPTASRGPVPCVCHIHGGGMVLSRAADPWYVRWRNELAATGMVVAGVEFRNGAGVLGNHPFPAGLDDCNAGLAWVSEHTEGLGISKVIVSGESGGANLSLATALRAKRDGTLRRIAGVYAQCPYISNAWAPKTPDLPSLYENDEYLVSCRLFSVLASVYDLTGDHEQDPLCWPYYARPGAVEGLPPHVISVNELDPLRDEGLAYFRTLLKAGVGAVSRTVNGTCHGGDVQFRAAMPDVYAATVRDIKGFADAV